MAKEPGTELSTTTCFIVNTHCRLWGRIKLVVVAVHATDITECMFVCSFVLPAAGRTNVELREQLARPERVTQAIGSFTSKRPSATLMTREHSGTQLKGSPAEKPPVGPGRKPRLDVQSSGYGIRREKSGDLHLRREKSGELRAPSGPARKGSDTKLKGVADKPAVTKKVPGSRVKKSDSQTSLGSTGSLEDPSESPRASSGIPSSPSSTSSSRGSPVGPSSAALKSTARKGSRENVRGSRESLHKPKDGKETSHATGKKPVSGSPAKSPPKPTKNGEKK